MYCVDFLPHLLRAYLKHFLAKTNFGCFCWLTAGLAEKAETGEQSPGLF